MESFSFISSMCGILCLISRFEEPVPTNIPIIDSKWETKDTKIIQDILHEELELSQTDLNKLNNQDKLRHLNNELIKLGNNIKVDNLEKILKVKNEIDLIIGTDTVQQNAKLSISEEFDSLIPLIAARGPDYLLYESFKVDGNHIKTFSSILSLRQPFTSQPMKKDRYIVQFNGELYNLQCEFTNDTVFLVDLIMEKGVHETLSGLNGEFAFTIIDTEENCIYFGRDNIGKRSLCYSHTDNSLLLSSVPLEGYLECEGNTYYTMDLRNYSLKSMNYYDSLPIIRELNYDDNQCKVEKIYTELKKSCFIRQETIFPLVSTEADLAVLFSGGIDCTIAAALLMENFIEMNKPSINIDLLTVGFDNPRTNISASESPDRELSIKSWFHLAKKYKHPKLSVRLIEINVDYKSWLLHKKRVQKLMYPQQTEMDLSIAIAFYFASSNMIPSQKMELMNFDVSWEDFLQSRDSYVKYEEYNSLSKVLFSGLGADELFGGYSRHEALFSGIKPEDNNQDQYNELADLLKYDIEVLYKRNLGRDDRVISTWGKELRYPYLDINFIKMVMQEIEPNLKIKLEWITSKKGKIITKPIRKWILRKVAEYMGLGFVLNEPKRAIQFGSKSAKLEIGQSKAKGTDAL